jgi:hypothetical protein
MTTAIGNGLKSLDVRTDIRIKLGDPVDQILMVKTKNKKYLRECVCKTQFNRQCRKN